MIAMARRAFIAGLAIILVALSLGLIYQQIEINNLKSPQASPSPELTPTESPSPSFNPSPLATATVTSTPFLTPISHSPSVITPTPAASPIPISNIALSYNESSRQYIGGPSRVILNVTATYISGNDITINYSQFSLRLYVWRMITQIPQGYAYPLNSGSFTLGISQKTYTFELIFEFGTDGFNGMDTAGIQYNLEYNGTVI
jgi:hypothetical protein